MHRLISTTTALFALASLSGCLLLNDVVTVEAPGYAAAPDRALVVVGIKTDVAGIRADGVQDYFQAGATLYEYDMKRRSITGGCWRFNKIEGAVPATGGPMRYLVFDAAPGYYAGWASNVAFLGGQRGTVAFEVPPGRIVYVADFVHTKDRGLALLRDFEAAKRALATSFPDLKGELVLANATPVQGLHTFMCTP